MELSLKELQAIQQELKEKMQNEVIDKLADLVDAYLEKVSKKGYSMTLHELIVFETIWKQIDYIDKNCR